MNEIDLWPWLKEKKEREGKERKEMGRRRSIPSNQLIPCMKFIEATTEMKKWRKKWIHFSDVNREWKWRRDGDCSWRREKETEIDLEIPSCDWGEEEISERRERFHYSTKWPEGKKEIMTRLMKEVERIGQSNELLIVFSAFVYLGIDTEHISS